jgi:hypothetical protein
MNTLNHNIAALRLVDLVLEPFASCENLNATLRDGKLSPQQAEHLAALLPRAVAQLDAIGDPHGALALASLEHLLTPTSLLASRN